MGISKALQHRARGMSLHKAAEAEAVPYSSLRKAWKAMAGDSNGPAWKAFVAALPPAPPPATTPQPAAAIEEAPLGPRLRRKADRYGDAVPYGGHGEWGMYREGTKKMTKKISDGELTAAVAAELLAAEGVHITADHLNKLAKTAPGESPVKAGKKLKVAWDLQASVYLRESQGARKRPLAEGLQRAQRCTKRSASCGGTTCP